MISMNAQDRGFELIQGLLQLRIPFVLAVICRNIPKDHDYIVPCWFETLTEALYLVFLAVNVAGVVNHSGATFPSVSISIIFAIVF